MLYISPTFGLKCLLRYYLDTKSTECLPYVFFYKIKSFLEPLVFKIKYLPFVRVSVFKNKKYTQTV